MNLQSKFKWLMAAVLIVSICLFYATRDSVPNRLVLFTGQPGGFYHQVGSHMTGAWEEATQRKLDLHSSSGSRENYQALRSAKADLALIQGGVEDLSELSIIAPLSHDLVHVIVRKDASIGRIQDLKGHTIAVGMPNSGMASSAEKLLHFY